jgi:serine/threonine protein kinase
MEAGELMDIPDEFRPLELQAAEAVDLNVPLDVAELMWHNVIVTLPGDEEDTIVTRRRLLLVDTPTQIAYDAGLGTTLQCGMLQLTPQGYARIEGAHIDVRRVCKTPRVRTNIYNGPGCIYSPGTDAQMAGWVPITVNDDKYSYYTQGTSPMAAVMIKIDGFDILRLQDPFANLAIILDMDQTMSRGTAGVLLKPALLGEVRMASRMMPQPDGNYIFSARPEDLVAIKILKHFNNDAQPRGTRELNRDLYDREDAIKEIELTGYVGRCPNPDYPPHFQGHPNVMQFLRCLADRNNIYMVMEYVNRGDLFEAVFEDSLGAHYFHEENSKDCLRQILSGVRFLHEIGVAHMDISSENVFVHAMPNGRFRFILADLGQSVLHVRHLAAENYDGIDRFMLLPPYRQGSAPGKKMYYVPETYLSQYPAPFNGFKVDMWQLGVLHIVVFCRSVPFHPERGIEQLQAWLNVVRRGQVGYINVRPPLAALVPGMPPPPPPAARAVYFSVGYPAVYDITNRMLQFFPRDREMIYDTHHYYALQNMI